MPLPCEILLEPSKRGFYKPGDKISGVIRYKIVESLETGTWELSLVGESQCAWVEASTTVKSKYTSYIGDERILKMDKTIINAEKQVAKPGTHEQPFEFHLPENIPSSYDDPHSTINYQLKFPLKNSIKFSITVKKEINVRGTELPHNKPVSFKLQKSLFTFWCFKIPKIVIKGDVNKTHFKPGEKAHFNLLVINDTNIMIPPIRIELYNCNIYTANGGRVKKTYETERLCRAQTEIIEERSQVKLSCVVPTLPDQYTIRNSKVLSREYNFRVMLRVARPRVEVTATVPVYIGEIKEDEGKEASEPSAATLESPPSYWEVVNVDYSGKYELLRNRPGQYE